MSDLKIKLSYWVYPEGDDFDDIDSFKSNISKNYDTEIIVQKTDALGGGLYEVIVEIISSTEFADIAKDLVEDGLKVGIVYFWKPIFAKLKELFKKNKNFTPDIEVAKFIFKDIEIIVYPLYEHSISEVIDEVIQEVAKRFVQLKDRLASPVKSIHVPIFNQVDTYEVCAYRVRLNVDENIQEFVKADYFKFWGIRDASGVNYVYELKTNALLSTNFYTQSEYDDLLDKKFETEI